MGDGRTGTALLRLPVRARGVDLGYPVDLILDADARRVLGFEVRCGDDLVRFLPFGAARVGDDEISVGSALLLLEPADVAFYQRRGRSLRGLRGVGVNRKSVSAGQFEDVVVREGGDVERVIVSSGGVTRRLPADASTTLRGDATVSPV